MSVQAQVVADTMLQHMRALHARQPRVVSVTDAERLRTDNDRLWQLCRDVLDPTRLAHRSAAPAQPVARRRGSQEASETAPRGSQDLVEVAWP